MTNRYLKCLCFTILIFFWMTVFSSLIVYLDLVNENIIRTACIRISGCIFILFLIYFQKKQVYNACLFLLSLKKRYFLFLGKYFVFICLSFALITVLAWFSGIIHLKENAVWNYQLLWFCLLNASAIAIYEEVAFRGLVAVYFRRYLSEKQTILFSSIVFMIAHWAYFAILPLITVFLIGVLFALLTFRCKSLYPAIGIHAGWDFSYFIFDDYFQPVVALPVWGETFEFYQIGLYLILILLVCKTKIIKK